MLNQVDFSQYNQKYQNDGIHDPIDWSKYELQYVYEHIDRVETEEKSYPLLLPFHVHFEPYLLRLGDNSPKNDVGNADDKSTHIDDDDDDDNGNVVTTTDDVIKDDSDIPLKRERLAL
ncbi:unnamed protein product [Trichobilharzia regenti]|nr:unnamed protein product [Trichobilharzia regenti]